MMIGRILGKCGGLTSDIAPYYVNPYTWCSGQCVYCWAEHWRKPYRADEKWIKKDVHILLDNDLKQHNLTGSLWIGCFADAYQLIEKELELTRKCIKTAHDHGVKVTILTKFRLTIRDFDLEPDTVGISLISLDDKWRRKYEPNSDSAVERLKVIIEANNIGLKTFINIEPLLRLEDFQILYPIVKWVPRILVGKLNPRQKNQIDFSYPNYQIIKKELNKYSNIEFKRNF